MMFSCSAMYVLLASFLGDNVYNSFLSCKVSDFVRCKLYTKYDVGNSHKQS
jgi:hypothetical protein